MTEITDRTRALWCVTHSAQVFWKHDPIKMVRIAHFPNGEDGFIACEVEGLPVPGMLGPVVVASGYLTKDDAIIAAIDKAMAAASHRPHPNAHPNASDPEGARDGE